MFRRSTTPGKSVRDLGVKFCDGCWISTAAERSARRMDAARTAVVAGIPRI